MTLKKELLQILQNEQDKGGKIKVYSEYPALFPNPKSYWCFFLRHTPPLQM